MLGQVPGISIEDLKRFDDRVMQLAQNDSNSAKASDRVLKTMFKKLTSNFIGKDVAQRFKNDVVIKNLPTLQLEALQQKIDSCFDFLFK